MESRPNLTDSLKTKIAYELYLNLRKVLLDPKMIDKEVKESSRIKHKIKICGQDEYNSLTMSEADSFNIFNGSGKQVLGKYTDDSSRIFTSDPYEIDSRAYTYAPSFFNLREAILFDAAISAAVQAIQEKYRRESIHQSVFDKTSPLTSNVDDNENYNREVREYISKLLSNPNTLWENAGFIPNTLIPNKKLFGKINSTLSKLEQQYPALQHWEWQADRLTLVSINSNATLNNNKEMLFRSLSILATTPATDFITTTESQEVCVQILTQLKRIKGELSLLKEKSNNSGFSVAYTCIQRVEKRLTNILNVDENNKAKKYLDNIKNFILCHDWKAGYQSTPREIIHHTPASEKEGVVTQEKTLKNKVPEYVWLQYQEILEAEKTGDYISGKANFFRIGQQKQQNMFNFFSCAASKKYFANFKPTEKGSSTTMEQNVTNHFAPTKAN